MGFLHGLAGLPGPAGLTRFTAGATVPGKKPGKIYSPLQLCIHSSASLSVFLEKTQHTFFVFASNKEILWTKERRSAMVGGVA